VAPNCLAHRAASADFLQAQATNDFGEVKGLAQRVYGKKFVGGLGSQKPRKPKKKLAPVLGNGEGIDWDTAVEKMMDTDLIHS
jgi:DNA polymerase gamma 1